MMRFDALFFDMDGTLVQQNELMSGSFIEGFADQGLIVEIKPRKTSGCTDWEIMNMYLSEFPELSDEDKEHLKEKIAPDVKRIVIERVQKYGLKALPGAQALIKKLVSLKIYPGLLTGNMEDIVKPKLEAAGMDRADFFYGGFGDYCPKRVDTAKKALESAAKFFGHPVEPSRALVIGDTPNDIACARAVGAAVLALPTGRFSKEQLLEHEPDYILDDLCDIDGFLEILGYSN